MKLSNSLNRSLFAMSLVTLALGCDRRAFEIANDVSVEVADVYNGSEDIGFDSEDANLGKDAGETLSDAGPDLVEVPRDLCMPLEGDAALFYVRQYTDAILEEDMRYDDTDSVDLLVGDKISFYAYYCTNDPDHEIQEESWEYNAEQLDCLESEDGYMSILDCEVVGASSDWVLHNTKISLFDGTLRSHDTNVIFVRSE